MENQKSSSPPFKVVRIFLSDGTFKSFKSYPADTTNNLLEQIAKKMHLELFISHFSLQEVSAGASRRGFENARTLSPNERPYNLMKSWEKSRQKEKYMLVFHVKTDTEMATERSVSASERVPHTKPLSNESAPKSAIRRSFKDLFNRTKSSEESIESPPTGVTGVLSKMHELVKHDASKNGENTPSTGLRIPKWRLQRKGQEQSGSEKKQESIETPSKNVQQKNEEKDDFMSLVKKTDGYYAFTLEELLEELKKLDEIRKKALKSALVTIRQDFDEKRGAILEARRRKELGIPFH